MARKIDVQNFLQNPKEGQVTIAGKSLGESEALEISNFIANNNEIANLCLQANNLADGVKHLCTGLATNESITSLNLRRNAIEVEGATAIANYLASPGCKLTFLDLCGNYKMGEGAIQIAKALKNNKSLTKFCFSSAKLPNQFLVELANSLKENTTLEDIDIFGNEISDITSLSEALSTNQSLKVLNLAVLWLADSAQSLVDGLAKNNTLQYLDITKTRISAEAVTNIISSNNSLTFLSAGDNNLKDIQLLPALTNNKTLTTLLLTNSQIDTGAILQLCDVLRSPSCCLQKLDLGWNAIGCDSCGELCQALTANSSLRELIMNKCDLADKGALAIANMLASNQILTVLDISTNAISETGLTAILDALAQNTTLAELLISENEFKCSIPQHFIDKNFTLTRLEGVTKDQQLASMLTRNKDAKETHRFKTVKLAEQ